MIINDKERAKNIGALTKWLTETAWKWNQGMEQADDIRGALISVGEMYEELLGSEIELYSEEDPDGTGFFLSMLIECEPPDPAKRDTVGPVRFEYVPGATPEQRAKYAEAMKSKREKAEKALAEATE